MTTIEPKGEWWPAEDYHQHYWEGEGQGNPYCIAVTPPKLQKLKEKLPGADKERQRDRLGSGPAQAVVDRAAERFVGDRRDRYAGFGHASA